MRTAYRQRVRKSAQTLVTFEKPYPESMDVCWSCLDRGDLNEAINEVTIQAFLQGETYDEVLEKLKNSKNEESVVVSEQELVALGATLRREMHLAEMLEAERLELEKQLKAATDKHSKFTKTLLSVKHSVQMSYDSLLSLDVRLADIEKQVRQVPTSDYALWEQFFKIEDHLTFASICGLPLAFNPYQSDTTASVLSWNTSSIEVQNISAAMVLVSSLLGRLMNNLPTARPEWFDKRKYRVVTTPAAVEMRTSGSEQRQVYHLTPFFNEKEISAAAWQKALLLLSDLIALMYRYWKCPPPYPFPQITETMYYALDLARPNQWNEKMRQLLLSLKQLIALRFPLPTSPSASPSVEPAVGS